MNKKKTLKIKGRVAKKIETTAYNGIWRIKIAASLIPPWPWLTTWKIVPKNPDPSPFPFSLLCHLVEKLWFYITFFSIFFNMVLHNLFSYDWFHDLFSKFFIISAINQCLSLYFLYSVKSNSLHYFGPNRTLCYQLMAIWNLPLLLC